MGRIYHLFRDMLMAIFGGLVGAILGLYGSGNAPGLQSLILIVIYGFMVGAIILVLDLIFIKVKKD